MIKWDWTKNNKISQDLLLIWSLWSRLPSEKYLIWTVIFNPNFDSNAYFKSLISYKEKDSGLKPISFPLLNLSSIII